MATLSFSIENILRRSPRCERPRDVMAVEGMTPVVGVVTRRSDESQTLTPTLAHLAAIRQVRKRLHMDVECSQDAEESDASSKDEDGEEIDVMGDAAPSTSSSSSSSPPAVTTTTDVSSTSNSPASDDTDDSPEVKRKKARTAFSSFQINELEGRYQLQRYLAANERKVLSERLGLKDHQVKTWFQNRRMKEKRQMREDPMSSSLTPGYSYDRPLAIGIPSMTSHPAFRDALSRGQVAPFGLDFSAANQERLNSSAFVSSNHTMSPPMWSTNQGLSFAPPVTLLRPDQYMQKPLPSGGYYLEPTIDVSGQSRDQTARPGVWSSFNSSLSVA